MKGVIKLHTSIYRGEHRSAAGLQGHAADCVTLPNDERWSTSPASLHRRRIFLFTVHLLLFFCSLCQMSWEARVARRERLRSNRFPWTGPDWEANMPILERETSRDGENQVWNITCRCPGCWSWQSEHQHHGQRRLTLTARGKKINLKKIILKNWFACEFYTNSLHPSLKCCNFTSLDLSNSFSYCLILRFFLCI